MRSEKRHDLAQKRKRLCSWPLFPDDAIMHYEIIIMCCYFSISSSRPEWKIDICPYPPLPFHNMSAIIRAFYIHPRIHPCCRFCPSVFLYLSSVVPAIWLLELDKIERRLRFEKETGELNLTAIGADLKKLDKLLGVHIKLPNIQVDPGMWVTLIEQFLMLILIVGRWMLPKGDLTRDQLSQLLLVYIGEFTKRRLCL